MCLCNHFTLNVRIYTCYCPRARARTSTHACECMWVSVGLCAALVFGLCWAWLQNSVVTKKINIKLQNATERTRLFVALHFVIMTICFIRWLVKFDYLHAIFAADFSVSFCPFSVFVCTVRRPKIQSTTFKHYTITSILCHFSRFFFVLVVCCVVICFHSHLSPNLHFDKQKNEKQIDFHTIFETNVNNLLNRPFGLCNLCIYESIAHNKSDFFCSSESKYTFESIFTCLDLSFWNEMRTFLNCSQNFTLGYFFFIILHVSKPSKNHTRPPEIRPRVFVCCTLNRETCIYDMKKRRRV